MPTAKEPTVDPEMLAHLDILENWDVLENSSDWETIQNVDVIDEDPKVSDESTPKETL